MNRIDKKFKALKASGKKALITFVTAGDPDIKTTERLVLEMEKNGADIIELGVPFSDPMAEGPVIQAANLRALKHTINLDIIMETVSSLRKVTQVPILYLLYYNSILVYGSEKFFSKCAEVGIDAVIVPDIPFEEKDEIEDYAKRYNVHRISLVAPTSHDRLKMICESSTGFLYCVSSLGVTGMRSRFDTDLEGFFADIKSVCPIPYCIGFGISSPQQASDVKHLCDGVIVGSAVVNKVATAKTPDEAVTSVGEFTKALRDSI
ncbi:MAG: tryptophan synthase subunit alpha [Bacillota bacterium]|nr:tryptophan synthase subunit alpha [Bacillota bacterium]